MEKDKNKNKTIVRGVVKNKNVIKNVEKYIRLEMDRIRMEEENNLNNWDRRQWELMDRISELEAEMKKLKKREKMWKEKSGGKQINKYIKGYCNENIDSDSMKRGINTEEKEDRETKKGEELKELYKYNKERFRVQRQRQEDF